MSRHDLYDDPIYGPRRRAHDYETAVALVRQKHPQAVFEGSTGRWRTIFEAGQVVGTAWASRSGYWYYRIKP